MPAVDETLGRVISASVTLCVSLSLCLSSLSKESGLSYQHRSRRYIVDVRPSACIDLEVRGSSVRLWMAAGMGLHINATA